MCVRARVFVCLFFVNFLPVGNHRVQKYLWQKSKWYTATSLFTKGGSEIGGISDYLYVYRSESRCVPVHVYVLYTRDI